MFIFVVSILVLSALSIFYSLPFIIPSLYLIMSPSFLALESIGLLYFLIKEYDVKSDESFTNQRKLQNIFDTLDVAIWSHDLKSDQLLITPGIEKLYGYKLEKFYEDYDFWKKVIYPEDLPILEVRGQKLAAGETVTSEYRIIRPGGEVRWIHDRGIPTLDYKGEFIDFSSVLFDITDRKESQGLYHSLVEMSPDIIAVVHDGVIDYINEAGYKLLGANNQEEIIGQLAVNYVPAQIIEQIRSKVYNRDNKEWQTKIRISGKTQRW